MALTTFCGWTRQIRRGVLASLETTLLDLAFPHFEHCSFRGLERREKYLHSLGLNNGYRLAEFEAIGRRGVFMRQRRYAGGQQLPPGSYHSVCSDATGVDDLTLCAELYTYVDGRVPGAVFVCDSNDTKLLERIGLTDSARQIQPKVGVFVLLFPPVGETEKAVWQKYYHDVLTPSSSAESPRCYFLPTIIGHVEIERTIDLRKTEAQEWFHERFVRLATDVPFAKRGGHRIPSFLHMLPELTNPERGGTETTHGIGSWLLANDVNALVFPSARNVVSVTMMDGDVLRFGGWNLVDYRAAREAGVEGGRFGDMNPWRTIKEHNADIQAHLDSSVMKGTWQMIPRNLEYLRARETVMSSSTL